MERVQRPARQDVLLRLSTQMLATPDADDRLSLILGAVTSELGYAHAAIALLDPDTGVLQIRAALGFPDDTALTYMPVPLNLGTGFGEYSGSGWRPVWITKSSSPMDAEFLNYIQCSTDLIGLPLFGGDDAPEGGLNPEILPQSLGCMGMLYIACSRDSSSRETVNLLLRLADRAGLTIVMAAQVERLTATIARLDRERQWVNAITKSVADPIVLTNLDNKILLHNRRAQELFGVSEEEDSSEGKLRALKMNDLVFSAYLSSVSFTSGEIANRDLTLVDPVEGSDVHFEVVSTPAYDSFGIRIGTVSVFRDMTDLRKANDEMIRNLVRMQEAEAEGRHERDRLNLIIENVGHPIVVADASGALILFNKKAELFFQQNDLAPQAVAAVQTNSVKLTSFISAMASSPRHERQAEIELIEPATGVTMPMEITSVEIPGLGGQVNAVVSILHDLSGIRELERRRMQQQLFESDKLAAIGRLTASIAHEINNPLEAIKNALYLLQGKSADDNRRFLTIALKETERVSFIIAQMLGIARSTCQIEQVDVNDLLDETLVLLDKKLRQAGIHIVKEFAPELPRINAMADQLRQVFLNLLLNAQQAISGKGKITVRTVVLAYTTQPSVSIEIGDTGIGIDEEDLARIFEPFFSTRKKGTGLGLWVTQDIVRHHGGRIEVSSIVNRGTTFRVVLPVRTPSGAELPTATELTAQERL